MAYSGLSLDGRVAVVVGGTTGIGRTLALGLAEAGADVVATSRRIEQVEETAGAIEAKGKRTVRVTSDVTDKSSLQAVLAKTIEKLGKVDILVNSAGAIKRVPTLEMEDATWHQILETNLTGTLRSCQVFGRHMLERGYGRIVNIASLNTFVSFLEVTAYASSKAGVAGLTRSLAVEWGSRGVNVNAIAPASSAPRSTRSCWMEPSAAKSCACARRSNASASSKSWSDRLFFSRPKAQPSSTEPRSRSTAGSWRAV